MIVLFTDFGLHGPYTGQMKAVLHHQAPGEPVIDLFSDVPAFAPRPAAYLLAAYYGEFPPGTVFVGVVDPGVGTAGREPVVVEAEGRWFVGPGNGLFDVIARRATEPRAWTIDWRPERLSASFHGRDLFAPVAAALALGEAVPGTPRQVPDPRYAMWPEELSEVVYCDHYGNGMTGIRAGSLPEDAVLEVAGQRVRRARTFGEVAIGAPLWYENANGLAEIAVNQGRADADLGIGPGTPVTVRA